MEAVEEGEDPTARAEEEEEGTDVVVVEVVLVVVVVVVVVGKHSDGIGSPSSLKVKLTDCIVCSVSNILTL